MRLEIFLYFFKTFKFIAIIVFGILLLRTFVIEPGRVNGRSMEPTFYDQDIFFINKFILLFVAPRRGQVIQSYDRDSGRVLIKRVVGLPGEEVLVKQNKVFIIGQGGQENFLVEPYLDEGEVTRSLTGEAENYGLIPEHQYFVLGDNREESIDSRVYGPVKRAQINGLVIDFSFLEK